MKRDEASPAGTRKLLLPGALAAVSLVLGAMAVDTATVVQQHRTFLAAHILLLQGGILNFSNQDDFTHQIYVETPDFTYESDEQEPGTIVTVKFPVSGHFTVRCHIHPKMHLDVDVQ